MRRSDGADTWDEMRGAADTEHLRYIRGTHRAEQWRYIWGTDGT